MRDTTDQIDGFLNRLRAQAVRKSRLYDGVNQVMPPDEALRYAVEELGEVATAMTRERYASAKDECVDLAHTAFLLYLAIERQLSARERDKQN